MSIKVLETVDNIFIYSIILCPELLCLATERLLSKVWTPWIYTGFDYDCRFQSHPNSFLWSSQQGVVSVIGPVLLHKKGQIRTNLRKALHTLKSKASFNSLALEVILKVLHSSCCRAGTSHSCVALYKGAGTSQWSHCLPEQFYLQWPPTTGF